jgi:valyl-tRNA synthetase
MKSYNPQAIEKKWQEIWRKNETFKAKDNTDQKSFTVLWNSHIHQG